MAELPAALRSRLQTEHALSAYDADVLVNQGQAAVAYFSQAAKVGGSGKLAANWVTQSVSRILNERPELRIETFPISSETLGRMIELIQSGKIPSSRSPDVFAHLVEAGSNDVTAALVLLGIEQVDESELIALCEKLLAANPKSVADVRAGKMQAVGALIGQAKKLNPNIDPARVRELCLQLIQAK